MAKFVINNIYLNLEMFVKILNIFANELVSRYSRLAPTGLKQPSPATSDLEQTLGWHILGCS